RGFRRFNPERSLPISMSVCCFARQKRRFDLDDLGDRSLLLGSEEVPPVHENNASGRSPYLLTCDHYGRLIPRVLGDLGVPAAELTRHIAWNIGIAGVADALSGYL